MTKAERYLKQNQYFSKAIVEFKTPLKIRVKERLLELAKKECKSLIIGKKNGSLGYCGNLSGNKKYKTIISVGDKNNYIPILAHEIGHLLTLRRRKILSYLCGCGRSWNNKEYTGIIKLGDLWNLYVNFRLVIYSEKIASRKGLELLKKCGYGEEELKIAEKYLKLALGTYLSQYKYLKALYS